jgi:DNA helicase II / ATP-dependent DNA helicase PcrA
MSRSAVVRQPAPRELTDEQRAIAEYQAGPALVLAGVGSGKTLVLAERAAIALRQGRDPATMLALTFTNRAAREMRARLRAVVGPDADEVGVGTFHAFCARVLRRDGKPLGIESHFVIWDEIDRTEALETLLAERGRGVDQRTVKACVEWISRTKSVGYLPQTLPIELQEARWAPVFRRYQRLLADCRALDYDDLIVQTWTLFRQFPAICRRWAERCSWVEVDEGQDTAPLEYDILRDLTAEHRNLCLFGDLRQAIYGWRGVHGERIVADFRADFPEHLALPLTRNFRATPPLQAIARSIFDGGWRDIAPPAPLAEFALQACADEAEESRWIAARVVAERERGTPWSGIAVLARTNAQLAPLVEALGLADIPLATVATRERFRQPAVKDLTAYLRLILDPYDAVALRRVINTPDRGLHLALLDAVEREGAPVGLALTDFADEGTLAEGDPWAYALAMVEREWVAIDVETTGEDVARDEPVALGAVLVNGRTGARQPFDRLLRPEGEVGDSLRVHGLSDKRLREEGEDPVTALAGFRAFIGTRPLVGHNLDAYDIPILNTALARHGLPSLRNRTIDTLRLARRALDLDRHHLRAVARACGATHLPKHEALADALAVADCFPTLAGLLAETALARRNLVGRYAPRFRAVAALLGDWQARAPSLPVSDLLTAVARESGYLHALDAWPRKQEAAIQAFQELRTLAAEGYDAYAPDAGLRRYLEFLSLARNLDQLQEDQDRVLLATLHLAKGLEFDAVFLAGVADGTIPHWRSKAGEALEEERRVLYVGVTRARERVYASYATSRVAADGRVWHQRPSPFLTHLTWR